MLFCSTSARVAGSGTVSHSTGMAAMWRLTAISRAVSWRAQPGCGPWRSSQDASSPWWLPVAVDERRPDVPPEYRCPVVAAAGIAAVQVPAVLPEPVPQGGATGSGQHVRADPHHAAAAVVADLAVFEEEVDPARGQSPGRQSCSRRAPPASPASSR